MGRIEKEWYTIQSIAKRWNVGVEDICHYIESGNLLPAVRLHKIKARIFDRPENMRTIYTPGHRNVYINFNNSHEEAKKRLDMFIKQEVKNSYPVTELVSDRNPVEKILRVVKEEKIDLLEEGRIEHALFGGDNDAIIRRMPCSILLVKNDPGPVKW